MDEEPLRSFALQSVCCTRGLLGQLAGTAQGDGEEGTARGEGATNMICTLRCFGCI